MTRPRGLASRAFPCLLLLFFLAAPSALALDATFDFYPKSAQSCLSKAAKSSACSGDTAKELNTCLCSNGGQFVEYVIRCLALDDNDELLGDVYTTMDGACSTSGTPLSWKWSDWVDTAKSAKSSSSSSSSSSSTKTTSTETSSTETSSTTSTKSTSTTLTTATASSTSSDSSSPSSSKAAATATNSPTSSPSSSPGDDSSSNLSTTATIGVAVGVSVAGVAAIAALAFFLVRKRKRASRPPMTYSMLTPEKYNGAGGGAATSYPPHGPSPSNLGGAGGAGGGSGGGAAGFDSEVNETPLYTVPTYVSKSQRKQSYTALSSTIPDSALEQQKQQHNFLSGWEPPTHAPQYAGPYHPPQTGPVELPPQMQPVFNVFELDSHGVGAAAPRPAQPALQPIAERQRESRMYRPYMPT
ncbi:hypothetical protein BBO_01854 [Beauveria brongniartii RCEF 3172]|uniref:Extracellular membrane protein, CFEM domain protein n=1 Tax=Beauveria brongniartii RCEF 3172 TaxID=1081107 RepID=A0A167JGG2_9HYPO|nr:hypothetical protein BBO_01854 [Beauveria brongniartii RCEF 3172]